MRASSREFAAALADRLNRAVPTSCQVLEEGGDIHVWIQGTTALELLMSADQSSEDPDRVSTEQLETDVRAVLSSVQDVVSEHLREPWPSRDGLHMALPGVRSDDRYLYLWYGEEREPVLGFPAIKLVEALEH